MIFLGAIIQPTVRYNLNNILKIWLSKHKSNAKRKCWTNEVLNEVITSLHLHTHTHTHMSLCVSKSIFYSIFSFIMVQGLIYREQDRIKTYSRGI